MAIRLPAALGAAALLLLAACSATPPAAQAPACPTDRALVPNAEYIGRYMGLENAVDARAFAQDLHCADAFKAARFPAGFVTIFGSSRLRDTDASYTLVRRFAAEWTRRHGARVPVMTGAGPGLMEAGNLGAREAGGPSVGYTTYYDRPTGTPDPQRPYGGDPRQALNAHVTHGLIFTSVTARELAMLRHSAAVLVAPGGTGTEWELFQLVEMVKSRQLAPVPVYLLGDRRHWASLRARLDDMVARGTIRQDEVAFVKDAGDADTLVRQLEADLRLR
jgi:predicted Rossmann-fold nucleotide-binding protein